MDTPEHFAEHEIAEMHRLIAAYPLGTLVTLGSAGLNANPIPFLLVEGTGENGVLHGPLARANRARQDCSAEHEALVIFQGPGAYISPNWYPTKAETDRQAPTYNYATVHAYGPLSVRDDEKWLRGFLGRLTKTMESAQPKPWKMGVASRDYVRELLGEIVGIESPIARLVGKWKVSQNRLPIDRHGAAAGLRATERPEAVAMADLIVETAERNGPHQRT